MSFADTLGISGNYRTFGQWRLYYREPALATAKSRPALS